MLNYHRFKEISELFSSGKTDEARRMLMELQSRYLAMHDQVDALKSQVREFEDILYLSKNLEYDGSSFWLKTGKVKQGPFCPECYERDGSLMRMENMHGDLYCNVCGARRTSSGQGAPAESKKVIQFVQ